MLTALTQRGWGVKNYGKHADIILERSLMTILSKFKFDEYSISDVGSLEI